MIETDWRCGGCGEPSREPTAEDNLIQCPKCGIFGVTSKEGRERSRIENERASTVVDWYYRIMHEMVELSPKCPWVGSLTPQQHISMAQEFAANQKS